MSSRVAALVILISLLAVTRAFAGVVSIDRILREHTVYVATNEPSADLSRYWLDWRPANAIVTTPTELYNGRNKLVDGAFIIWIIDRTRTRMIPEQEALLPCALSGIDPNEVLVFASKTGNKRSDCRKGRWDILITAPNRKWLYHELDRLGSAGLLNKPIAERGTVLDRYCVKRMCIVSTEGKQIAEDWVRRQSSPGSDAIDWDFIRADSWVSGTDPGTDMVFLLNRDALTGKSAGVVSLLPDELQSWVSGAASKDECAAARKTIQNSDGQARSVAAVVGPCARHLKSILGRYSSLGKIPEALATSRLTDLSPYPRVVVVARPGDRTFAGQGRLLDDFAGKITAAISSADLGFQCESRQDLKELIYESLRRGEGDIDRAGVDQIRSRIAGACALVVADLAAVNAQTTYVANAPQCATPAYPAFDEPRPSQPSKPNPRARAYGLFGPRVYPGGENDPKYREAYKRWKDEMDEYEHAIRRWEVRKREYEERRAYHDMEWVISMDTVQRATVTGNLRIYDLSSFEGDSNTSTGKVVYSCALKGSCERRHPYKSDRAVVRGEDARPETPAVPPMEEVVSDETVVSEALQSACRSAVAELVAATILPSDRPSNARVAGPTAPPQPQRIQAEATGGIKLRRKPLGDGIDVARQAALHDAYPKLVYNVHAEFPNCPVSDQDIRDRARVVSEGWDAASGQYRVKVRYEGESVAQLPPQEVPR